MRPRERRETGEQDLFRSRLDQIINMNHELVKLARSDRLALPRGEVRRGLQRRPGHAAAADPADGGAWRSSSTPSTSPTRSCARAGSRTRISSTSAARSSSAIELPFDRSSMTRWRQRMGEERIRRCCRRAWRSRSRPGR